jgi:hypothetical protein
MSESSLQNVEMILIKPRKKRNERKFNHSSIPCFSASSVAPPSALPGSIDHRLWQLTPEERLRRQHEHFAAVRMRKKRSRLSVAIVHLVLAEFRSAVIVHDEVDLKLLSFPVLATWSQWPLPRDNLLTRLNLTMIDSDGETDVERKKDPHPDRRLYGRL